MKRQPAAQIPSTYSGWGDQFDVFIPTGRALNPITKTDWEGTGIKPDAERSAAEGFQAPHVAALWRAVESTEAEGEKKRLQQLIDEVQHKTAATAR